MDTLRLTTICTSPSPSDVPIYMVNVAAATHPVYFDGCYSCGGSESRSNRMQISSILPLNSMRFNHSTTKGISSTKLMIPQICGIIISLVILNLVITLHDFYLSFRCIVSIFKSFLCIFSCIWNVWAASTTSGKRPLEKDCCTKRNIKKRNQRKETNQAGGADDDRNPCLLEVKMVIEGALCNRENEDKIGGLFEEDEPSLEEVKEAFDVFDENKDGFIDTNELRNVLFSLRFMEASEEDCKRMIKGFDYNLDGRIDLGEFIKVMEKSFA
ncbi:Calcium-binding EF-hand [Corchorus olitorius]|uniref:Calcium-binding EF-hand n=1 Tax=Corchorus olitorius TaxID=93759 RepID=A0A1R3G6B5_9ROSI|nr:Calcium-binding EF-hand [Corchorus olitorius]